MYIIHINYHYSFHAGPVLQTRDSPICYHFVQASDRSTSPTDILLHSVVGEGLAEKPMDLDFNNLSSLSFAASQVRGGTYIPPPAKNLKRP